MTDPTLANAYQYCAQLTRQHYENFPVASLLLPKDLQQAISVIYAFARQADDVADEGDRDNETRLRILDDYSEQLNAISRQCYRDDDPVFIALADVIQRHQLPIELFHDLLTAFKQDVSQNRYASDQDILAYCRYSANPIGQLLLQLTQYTDRLSLLQSDAICTALQLINFYQDIEQDFTENNRLYLPTTELDVLDIKPFAITSDVSLQLAPLLRDKFIFTADLLSQGLPLGYRLTGRFGWQIRFTVLAALLMLFKLSMQNNDRLFSRPRFRRSQLFKPAFAALTHGGYESYSKYLLLRINTINQQKR